MNKGIPLTAKICVVIPNWNGAASMRQCIDSLVRQSLPAHIIMVDNGSVDSSVELVTNAYPEIEIIKHTYNKGYAGGVNPGFVAAIEHNYDYVAPFNNDAIADKDWLKHLVSFLDKNPAYGIAACKLLDHDGSHLDSSGECYTVWGLPYPRGRDETNINAYDTQTEIFAASGGASLYRTAMLCEVGLLDEDFFAYYEDVDLSFRAQSQGWKVAYVPASRAYHQISATGGKIKGFFTYQTIKNLPWIMWKNVPAGQLWHVAPRFTLAYWLFIGRAIQRGQAGYALKGLAITLWLTPKKLIQRHHIQKARRKRDITSAYIWSMLVHDLPPNAHALRKLRGYWMGFRGTRGIK